MQGAQVRPGIIACESLCKGPEAARAELTVICQHLCKEPAAGHLPFLLPSHIHGSAFVRIKGGTVGLTLQKIKAGAC